MKDCVKGLLFVLENIEGYLKYLNNKLMLPLEKLRILIHNTEFHYLYDNLEVIFTLKTVENVQ